MKNQGILHYSMGSAFQLGIVFAGYTFILVGLFTVFQDNPSALYVGIAIIIIGILMALSTQGTEINTKNKTYRNYTKFFGLIKYGKWLSLEAFQNIVVIPQYHEESVLSQSNRKTSMRIKLFEIFLFGKNIKNRVQIYQHKKQSVSEAVAQEISDKCGLKLAKLKNKKQKQSD